MSEKKVIVGAPQGLLEVWMHEAKSLRDVQTIGTQDPFCKLKLGKKDYKTRVHSNGGKVAKWSDTFFFSLKGRENEINLFLTVVNSNIVVDKDIGSAIIPVAELVKTQPRAKWYKILHENKECGEVCLTATWHPALTIEVVECKDLYDTQTLGKQDPYVRIKIGKKDKNNLKTKTCTDGNKTPKWKDQKLTFARALPEKSDNKEHKEPEPEFEIEVMNDNTLSDDLIGRCKLLWSVAEGAKGKGIAWYQLYRDGDNKKQAGLIALNITEYVSTV